MSLKVKRKRSPIILDSTRLCKQCVIGCTVLPSRDDPQLTNGVALTTLAAWDETYVKFEDIDAYGEPSYRYWKDVYLIAAWNDTRYPALQVGDKAFALYQNPDGSFTTVYYHAQIRAKPTKKNGGQIVIDFLDGTGKFTNIKMSPFTKIQTKEGPMTVPTLIRNLCVTHTQVHRNAMQELHLKKSKAAKARSKTDINTHNNKLFASRSKIPPNTRTQTTPNKQHANHHTSNRSTSLSATPSERFTPLKKSTKNHKKQMQSESDSDTPIVAKHKTSVVNNMNIGVASSATNAQPVINVRKRKYDEMNNKTAAKRTQNTHNPQTLTAAQPPPRKRQRSSRRKAQKLKIPANNTNNTSSTANTPIPPQTNHLQRNVSNASTVSNVSNISSTPAVSTNALQKQSAPITIKAKLPPHKSASSLKKSAAASNSAAPQQTQKKVKSKKRMIKFKRKKKNTLNSNSPASSVSSTITTKTTPVLPAPPVLPTPPPIAIPSQMVTVKESSIYQRLIGNKFPEKVVLQAIKQCGNNLKHAYKYCADEMRKEQKVRQKHVAPVRNNNIVSMQKQAAVQAPQQMMNLRKKFKKMWGNYEIEMPVIEPQGFELFDNNDLYLEFKTNVQQIRAQTMKTITSTDGITNGEWFVSGLNIRQKWTEPQEIGPITVGPYVVDMDIMD